MGKAERGALPVIASHRGRRRGGPEVTGPFAGDGKTQEGGEGNRTGGERRRRCCRALQRDDQRRISSIPPLMRAEDHLMYSFHGWGTDEKLRLNRLSLCLELLSTEFNDARDWKEEPLQQPRNQQINQTRARWSQTLTTGQNEQPKQLHLDWVQSNSPQGWS